MSLEIMQCTQAMVFLRIIINCLFMGIGNSFKQLCDFIVCIDFDLEWSKILFILWEIVQSTMGYCDILLLSIVALCPFLHIVSFFHHIVSFFSTFPIN